MTTIINVPHSLEDKSFEQVLDQVAPLPLDEKIIVDTRHARWASPYGLTALLALAQSRAERPVLYVPEAENVSHYWSRMDFFKHAAELYEIQGRVKSTKAAETSVLLEVTSISKSDDVHVELPGTKRGRDLEADEAGSEDHRAPVAAAAGGTGFTPVLVVGLVAVAVGVLLPALGTTLIAFLAFDVLRQHRQGDHRPQAPVTSG